MSLTSTIPAPDAGDQAETAGWLIPGFPVALRKQIVEAARKHGQTVAEFVTNHFEHYGLEFDERPRTEQRLKRRIREDIREHIEIASKIAASGIPDAEKTAQAVLHRVTELVRRPPVTEDTDLSSDLSDLSAKMALLTAKVAELERSVLETVQPATRTPRRRGP